MKINELKEEYKDNETALQSIKKLLVLVQNSKAFFDVRKFGEIIIKARL